MKKLMVAAAAAAMATGAFATTQVYQMSMNMMTTTCAQGQVNANVHPFVPDIVAPASPIVPLVWRTPTTVQILGLIWMCDCNYLVDLGVWANTVDGLADTAFGGVAGTAAGHPLLPAGRTVGSFNYTDRTPAAIAQNAWQYYVSAFQDGDALPAGANNQYNLAYNTLTDTYTWANREDRSAEGYIFWEARTGAPVFYGEIDKTYNFDGIGAVDIWDWRPAYEPTAALRTYDTQAAMPTFAWDFLQRIGQYGEQVEGAWSIADLQSGYAKYFLQGAGFGRMQTIGNTSANCTEVIASMTGYFAGYVPGGAVAGTPSTCTFCGSNGTPGATCVPWRFCVCNTLPHRDHTANARISDGLGFETIVVGGQTVINANMTAAYGVWQLQYNPTLSARLNTTAAALTAAEKARIGCTAGATIASIRKIFNFSTATAEIIEWLEACRL